MLDMNFLSNAHSRESEIDRTIEELIEQMVLGTLSDAGRARFLDLLAQRSHLMRPTVRASRPTRSAGRAAA
jgi:hypothetical protein